MVGGLGLWALNLFLPKSQLVSVEPNLSRNPRVCLGFRLPRGKALVHGEEGSLRIGEEKALEFYNFFSRFTKENGKCIFSFFTKPCLGLPRSARAYNPLVRREGRLGLGFPKKFQSPSSCLWNLSRNPRVRQGLRRPRRNAPVHGEEGGAPGTRPEACQFGEAVGQEPVSENPRQTRLLLPESSPRPKGTRARFYSPDGEDRPLWDHPQKKGGGLPTPGPANSALLKFKTPAWDPPSFSLLHGIPEGS